MKAASKREQNKQLCLLCQAWAVWAKGQGCGGWVHEDGAVERAEGLPRPRRRPVLALQASIDDYLTVYPNLNASVKDVKDKEGKVTVATAKFLQVSYVINVVGVQKIVTCDVAKVLLIVMKSGIHSTVTSSFSLFFLHVRKILRNFAVT